MLFRNVCYIPEGRILQHYELMTTLFVFACVLYHLPLLALLIFLLSSIFLFPSFSPPVSAPSRSNYYALLVLLLLFPSCLPRSSSIPRALELCMSGLKELYSGMKHEVRPHRNY
jgi:hypothetical protein